MPPRVDDVMKLCCELSANQQVKTAVKQSGKGAAAAGGLAFAGGLIGGPLGIAVGKSINALHTAYNRIYTVTCDAGFSYQRFCLFKVGLLADWLDAGWRADSLNLYLRLSWNWHLTSSADSMRILKLF